MARSRKSSSDSAGPLRWTSFGAGIAVALAVALAIATVVLLSMAGPHAVLERLLAGPDAAPDVRSSTTGIGRPEAHADPESGRPPAPERANGESTPTADGLEDPAMHFDPAAGHPPASVDQPPDAGPGGTIEQDRSADEAEPATRSIRGIVLDEAGIPLPGIEITAARVPAGRTGDAADAPAQNRSDELGMFEFGGLHDGEYLLTVSGSDDFHPASIRARAGSETADIHLQRKGEIRVVGTVRHDGEPLPDVRIRALGGDYDARTDGQGRYQITIDRTRVDGQPVLEFAARGYRPARERAPDRVPPSGEAVEIDVTLQRLNELIPVIGAVHGPEGEAVEGAQVSLTSTESNVYRQVTSGPLGEFEFDAVESGVAYRVAVDPAGRRYQRHVSEPIVVEPGNSAVDIVLEEGGEAALAGVVVDPSGDPLPHFRLWLRNTGAGNAEPIPVETDARGRFEPVLVGVGPVRLESRSMPRLEASGIDLAAGERLQVRVPIDWGERWLLGKVVDETGKPVARASISARWNSDFGNGRSVSSRQTRSDVAGFFGFGNLGARNYELTCSAPGFRTARLDVQVEPDRELVIRLERNSSQGGP